MGEELKVQECGKFKGPKFLMTELKLAKLGVKGGGEGLTFSRANLGLSMTAAAAWATGFLDTGRCT